MTVETHNLNLGDITVTVLNDGSFTLLYRPKQASALEKLSPWIIARIDVRQLSIAAVRRTSFQKLHSGNL